MGVRQESPVISLTTNVELQAEQTGDEAGLTVYQISDGHLDLGVRRTEQGDQVFLHCTLKSINVDLATADISVPRVRLRVESDGLLYKFAYSQDGQEFTPLGEVNCSLMSTEVAGGFTGVVLGLYAQTSPQDGEHNGAYADFSDFRLR